MLGHSYVRRLESFLNRDETSNFGLSSAGQSVTLIGQGRMTTAHLEQKIHYVGHLNANVVLIDIGLNDLALGYSFERLVRHVLAATSVLLSIYHVKQIVILEVLRRSLPDQYPCPADFNEQVVQYNTLLNHRIEAAGLRYIC